LIIGKGFLVKRVVMPIPTARPHRWPKTTAPTHHGLRALLAVLLASGLGCTHRLAKVSVPVKVPSSFSRSGSVPPPERWWRAFGDPELNRLVRLALADNPGLRIAWARLDQARAVARKAGAGLYPALNAEADLAGTISKESKSASLQLGLAASYEVDLWGRVRATRDAARLDLLATRKALEATAISLAAEIATAWYQLVERRGQLALLGRQLDTNQTVLILVSLRFEQGQGRAADVLQQRQLVESIRGEQVQAKAQVRVLEHQLAILTGRPPTKLSVKRVRRLPALKALPRTGVPAALLQRRPDVHSAYLKVRAADRRVAAALADRYPRLSLSAKASLTGGFNPAAFYSWLTNLAANLLAPLFDGGARRAEVARTRAVAAGALHEYGQTVLVALREVEDALTREQQQARYLASLDRQLRLSALVIEQLRHGYLNGAEEYLRVLDALLRHQALQRTRLAATRDRLLYRIALCRALAGGWKIRRPGAGSARVLSPGTKPQG
jgi:NodT family efflux transporter outer membrane factor (OMF) lipoprotein